MSTRATREAVLESASLSSNSFVKLDFHDGHHEITIIERTDRDGVYKSVKTGRVFTMSDIKEALHKR